MDTREAMARALRLAWQGWGRTGRNPMVGAVVLRNGAALAEAHHAAFGGPHAERVALKAAGAKAKGATLVVTLEPCRHQGKTPPCVDAIREAGIARVVYGAPDVDPAAQGGAAALRASGIAVEGGVLEAQARAQNAAFFHRHAHPGRPFVALKLAMSLDGRIADHTGRSRWVTGPEARDWVHWLRAGFEAVAAGLGTVRADDPQLTVRGSVRPPVPPLRVVFDRRGEMPLDRHLARTARDIPTLVIAEKKSAGVVRLREAGLDVAVADGIEDALGVLAARGVTSLLLEGGGAVAGRFLAADAVDRCYLLSAPIFLGSRGKPAFREVPDAGIEAALRWRLVGRHALGDDTLLVLDRP